MTREFKSSHPWIRFRLDGERLSWQVWTMLGECRASVEQVASVALRPNTAKRMHHLYLAKGVLATTAIEGNTLSEEEVARILSGELELPPSKEYLATEVKNIEAACQDIWKRAMDGEPRPLTPGLVREFNLAVREGLPEKEGTAPPGEVRHYAVGVLRYKAPPAKDCDYLLDELCRWLNSPEFRGVPGYEIEFSIIRAIMAHLYIAWIHPFGDGNGRTARILEFYTLVNAGLPSPCAHLLSNHYNQTRTEYYRQLDYTSRSNGDVRHFVQYAVQGLVDGLREQLETIRDEQLDITWRNYVHEYFRNSSTPAQIRRRKLALDLSLSGMAVSFDSLSSVTTRMAVAYAGLSRKTLRRDINWLVSAGLVVEIDKDIYWANKALLIAFRPMSTNRLRELVLIARPLNGETPAEESPLESEERESDRQLSMTLT